MSMFIFRRPDHGHGYVVHIRDTNERIGVILRDHNRGWDAIWSLDDAEKPVYLSRGTTRERAAALILMEHLAYTSREAIQAMRDMVRDWVTYTPTQQTVLLDELQSLRDASANLVAKIQEHIVP